MFLKNVQNIALLSRYRSGTINELFLGDGTFYKSKLYCLLISLYHFYTQIGQKERKPAFISELQPTKVIEGFPVKLEVKVLGHPQPTIKW